VPKERAKHSKRLTAMHVLSEGCPGGEPVASHEDEKNPYGPT